MIMLSRTLLERVISNCYKGKAIILYGARQVGKTTLTTAIKDHFPDKKTLYLTGDDVVTQEYLQPTRVRLDEIVAWNELIIIDEAQRITNIGLILKLLVDAYPAKQVIATGSSSFDLANQIVEPLTGRAYIFQIYPFSLEELSAHDRTLYHITSLEKRLIYGMYPEVALSNDVQAVDYLKTLITHYLYKDILAYDWIKKSSSIMKLLQALAFQVGNEVSYNELSQIVGIDKGTIEKYIDILEQNFIVKRLQPLYRNQRQEIKALKKIYFCDLWIRNAIINNFNTLSFRNDIWALRENFCFLERSKYLSNHFVYRNQYFWRSHTSWEVDYVEEYDGKYDCYEFKWSDHKKASLPKQFVQFYTPATFSIIRPSSLREFT